MSFEEQDYHRRRSELELEQAISAEAEESAVAHLALARMHRARRQAVAEQKAFFTGPMRIFGTDKEG